MNPLNHVIFPRVIQGSPRHRFVLQHHRNIVDKLTFQPYEQKLRIVLLRQQHYVMRSTCSLKLFFLKGGGTVIRRNNAKYLEEHVNNAMVLVKR